MELISFEPKTAPSFTLPMQEVVIVPIGDIQLGAAGADLDRLRRHITWALKTFPKNVYFIGMGDYLDIASPSNRAALYRIKGDLYDSVHSMMDDGVDRQLTKLKSILRPTVGRWLGLITKGHHYWEFGDGTTSDTRLAAFLQAPLLGHCALVHLIFKDSKGRRKAIAKIWAHHGQGGGVTLEAALRKVRTNVAPYWFANVYLIGHYHQKATTPLPWIDTYLPDVEGAEIEWNSVSRYIVSTGSFLKGYEAGSKDAAGYPAGMYPEVGMMPPNVLGGPVVFIRPRRRFNRTVVDVNVSV